jgi:hypothetical protein
MPDTPLNNYPTASEVRRAKENAVGGKPDRCVKGKSCSAACIAANEFCLVTIPDSVSGEISRVRAGLVAEEAKGDKQMPLFDTSKYVTKEGVKEYIDKFRRSNQESIKAAIENNSKEDYDKARQSAVDFNKKLVKDGLADKAQELAKVPVSWDKYQKVKSAYFRATASIEERMQEAAMMGDKAKYDKEERKLITLNKKIGSKVGDSEVTKKGANWDWYEGEANISNSFLKGVRESPTLKGLRIVPNDPKDGGGFGELTVYKRVGKHEVSVHMEDRGTSFSFQVNGSYRKPEGLSNKEGRAIAGETDKIFRELISHMNEGSGVRVFPYDDDGYERGQKRRRAYERFGFGSDPDTPKGGWMHGLVDGGRIVPANREEYRDAEYYNGTNFAETRIDRARTMYLALWGEEPA